MGITVPGDGSFNPGEGNAPNLNAGIGGGVNGAERELSEGHGLCGDIGSRRAFEVGPYGKTPSRGTFTAGGKITVVPRLTAYHAGWFEFRLCDGGENGIVTQECLNQHVLEIDESTPYYPAILDYQNMKGISKTGDGGWYKCQTTGGHFDATSKTPNTVWPKGSCCNDGGACSEPSENKDRYVVEFAGDGGVRDYEVVLKLPNGIDCDNCILQWMYQTANSRETYPESFWNCADIAVKGGTGPVSPTPQVTPTPQPTQLQVTPTPQPTNGGAVNPSCGSCTGCWWTAVLNTQGCYPWSQATCAAQSDAYVWCGAGGSQPTPQPTQQQVLPTPQPTQQQATPTPQPTPQPTQQQATPTPQPTFGSDGGAQSGGWVRSMSPEMIAKGHPWGISNFGPSGLSGLAAATAMYEDIKTALDNGPAEFGAFCNSGDEEADKREAAAFLANVLKETGGYSAFKEVSPHGTYCTWNNEGGSDLQAAGESFPCGKPFADQGYANEFIGRGAIQLTWNINYGRFSQFYFGDQDVLLKNPEIVEGDGPLGWAASLWFWMTPQDFGGQCPPKQLDSTMPLGHQSCHQSMSLAHGGGMGQTIRIINGGYEACPTSSYRSSAVYRMNYFLELCSLLGVPFASNPECRVNDFINCDVSGMEQYTHTDGTIGNPLIGVDSTPECPQCKKIVCTAAPGSKWLGVPDDPVEKLLWTCA